MGNAGEHRARVLWVRDTAEYPAVFEGRMKPTRCALGEKNNCRLDINPVFKVRSLVRSSLLLDWRRSP